MVRESLATYFTVMTPHEVDAFIERIRMEIAGGTFVATELGVGLGIQSERAEMRWSDASDAQQGGHIGNRERFRKIEPLYVSATPGFQQRELRGSFHSLDNHLDIECACQAKYRVHDRSVIRDGADICDEGFRNLDPIHMEPAR